MRMDERPAMNQEIINALFLALIASVSIGFSVDPKMPSLARCVLSGWGIFLILVMFVGLAMDIAKHAGVKW